MQLTMNGIQYTLHFVHRVVPHQPRKGDPEPRVITTAKLTLVEEPYTMFGGMYMHPRSKHLQFCKETGRKAALKKLVRHFTRPERTEVWQAYFARRIRPTSPKCVVINEAKLLPAPKPTEPVLLEPASEPDVMERISFAATVTRPEARVHLMPPISQQQGPSQASLL